ncbi:MAG: hypothetical protein ACRCUS_05190, partial [Anaerovoracaceae bacterium]
GGQLCYKTKQKIVSLIAAVALIITGVLVYDWSKNSKDSAKPNDSSKQEEKAVSVGSEEIAEDELKGEDRNDNSDSLNEDDSNSEVIIEGNIKEGTFDEDLIEEKRRPNPTVKYVYRTIFHEKKATISKKDAFAANQLEGGYRLSGSHPYNPKGGATYTISVSVGAPWGAIGFSGTTGKRGSGVYQIKSPDSKHYYKVKELKSYKTTPYTIQKREVGTAKWVNMSYGAAKGVLFDTYARCIKVK